MLVVARASSQAEYNSMTLSELKDHLKPQPGEEDEGEVKARFRKKRARCVEKLAEDPDATFGPEAFEIKETVTHKDSTGERRWRGGSLMKADMFEERFPDQKKRKGVSYQCEEIDNEKRVRVFDDVPGVLRFDNYADSAASHSKVLDDGTMKLSQNQAEDNYQAAVQQAFDQKKYNKSLTAADLGIEAGRAPAKKDLTRQASNASSSSGSSSETAPLAAACSTSSRKPKTKPKAKAKAGSGAPVIPIDADDDMEDKPHEKKHQAFMKQTNLKWTAAAQVVQHILEAPHMRDVDDSRIVSAIRTLDGRMPKILQAGLLKTKNRVEHMLLQLRSFSDLLKSAKIFEGKLRMSGKQVEAAAAMTSAFTKFELCKFKVDKLPWWLRTQCCVHLCWFAVCVCSLYSMFICLCSLSIVSL